MKFCGDCMGPCRWSELYGSGVFLEGRDSSSFDEFRESLCELLAMIKLILALPSAKFALLSMFLYRNLIAFLLIWRVTLG